MMKSMTGYGRSRMTVNDRDITVEIKAVNNRYFECNVRVPRAFAYLEDKIKSYVQSRGISRGKIEIFVSVEMPQTKGVILSLNEEYAEMYIDVLKKLRDRFELKDDITVMNVAACRDIFTQNKPEDDLEGEWENVKTVLCAAIEGFDKARTEEGGRLQEDITQKLAKIRENVEKIALMGDIMNRSYEARLYQRLREVLDENKITMNESRVLTECAVYADRVAIDEEIVRLKSHIEAFCEYMNAEGSVGKKLDFQIQEMNRETNTIGSKAQNSDLTRLVVDVKCELEKIREQIQNIE